MILDDAVSRIVEQTQEKMSGIDHAQLRAIAEEVLSCYNMNLKDGLESQSDIIIKAEAFYNSMRLDGLSEKTIKNYSYHISRFALHVQKPVSRITTNDIRAFLSMLVETRHLKNSTLETEKSILKAFFNWLESEEYISKSPAKKIRPTKIEKRIRKSLTYEELEMLRDACNTTRKRCLIELFYSTGVRIDELHKMDIHDISWQDNSIRVIGKGNKERIVYFSDRAKLYLKRYIAERGILGTDALFVTSKKPHNRMGHKSIQNEIKAIAKDAGIEKPVFPHLLRHSFATHSRKAGMSLETIHDLMGHERMDTTLTYAQSDQETARYEFRKYHNQ